MNEESTSILINRIFIDSNTNDNSSTTISATTTTTTTTTTGYLLSSSSSSSSSSPSTSATNSNSNSLNRSLINNSSLFNDFYDAYEVRNEKTRRSRSLISTSRDYVSHKRLQDDYNEAKRLLKEKDEKISKLNEIRDRLESEIRELTACLFEQAYAMVNEAKDEAAQSNKLLLEANGKIDVLEAEVKALKTLVTLTNTPTGGICTAVSQSTITTPKHHSNQPRISLNNIQTSHSSDRLNINAAPESFLLPNTPSILNNSKYAASSASSSSSSNSTSFNRNSFKSHKRTPSHNDVKTASKIDLEQMNLHIQNSHTTIPASPTTTTTTNNRFEIYEIDPIYFKEIVLWRENPDLDLNNTFISRVYNEDIEPCICFNNKELTEHLLVSIQSNCVCIEDISNSHPIDTMQVCSLSNIPSICQYKIKFNESSSQWYLISKLCRNRIISVCDFFTYLRYIKDGLVKSDNRDVYWNIIDLRRRMALSRLGL